MATNGFKLRLEIDGQTEFARTLHGAMANADDLAPLFDAIAAEVRGSIAARFAGEGAADGQPAWAALSADYAAWKAKRYPNQPILQRTGKLLAAASNPTATTTATSLTMTIESDYAVYRESRRPRGGRLPRRAFMALSGKQRARITRLLRDHLRAGLGS